MERLNGKVAVVTGGGSGIGRAIAERFAKEGAHVVIAGRKEQPLQETAAADGKISYVVGDITKTETIEEIVRTVQDKFGRLDILVNNAGWCPVQPITEITIEDYDRAFNLDVRAVVNLTIHALRLIPCATRFGRTTAPCQHHRAETNGHRGHKPFFHLLYTPRCVVGSLYNVVITK